MAKNDYKAEFIQALEVEIHKISPLISLQHLKVDPLNRILNIVRIATSTLLQEKQNLENRYLSNSTPVTRVSSPADPVQTKISSSTASGKLRNSEKHPESETCEKQALEQRFPDRRRTSMEKNIDRIQGEDSILKIKELEKERRELQDKSEKLKIKEKELNSLKETLATQQAIMKKESARIEREKVELEKLLGSIVKEKSLMQTQLESVPRTNRRPESVQSISNSFSVSSETPEPLDLPLLYEKMKQQISIYNSELSVRELQLYQGQQKLKKDKENLSVSIQRSQQIYESLEASKLQVLSFYNELIPELEEIYNKNSELMGDLKQEHKRLEELQKKIENDNFGEIGRIDNEVTFMDFRDSPCTVVKGAGLIRECGKDSESMEEKIKEIEKKEKELEFLIKVQEEKVKEMEKFNALIENEKKELEDEREKLKKKEYNVERQSKSLGLKESELRSLKHELEKRMNLLSIKENQMVLKKLQIIDTKCAQTEKISNPNYLDL